MKILIVILLFCFVSLAQDEGAETLSLPIDEKTSEPSAAPATPSNLKTELSPKKGKDNVGAILDFEGEVIEGERRRPDLFLQISIDNVKFDSLIYNRDDFNDYLEVDRKSRNKFFKMK